MNKIYLLASTILFCLCGSISTYGQQEATSANVKEVEKNKHAQAYQEQTISSITNRKDSLLQQYGSFEAARQAGALVKKQPPKAPEQTTTNTPK